MHIIFQRFIDQLLCATEPTHFTEIISSLAESLELPCFAYLGFPEKGLAPRLFSNYPVDWTSHYLKQRYERIDPVLRKATLTPDPFQWGAGISSTGHSPEQLRLLDEASEFGIRTGLTIPIHDGHGPIAALTFAAGQRDTRLEARLRSDARLLQLVAMYFHAQVRRRLSEDQRVGDMLLSARERQCLEWASRGKSAWETGRILGISRYTVASHLDSAKSKLGVRTVVQAAIQLAAATAKQRN